MHTTILNSVNLKVAPSGLLRIRVAHLCSCLTNRKFLFKGARMCCLKLKLTNQQDLAIAWHHDKLQLVGRISRCNTAGTSAYWRSLPWANEKRVFQHGRCDFTPEPLIFFDRRLPRYLKCG